MNDVFRQINHSFLNCISVFLLIISNHGFRPYQIFFLTIKPIRKLVLDKYAYTFFYVGYSLNKMIKFIPKFFLIKLVKSNKYQNFFQRFETIYVIRRFLFYDFQII